MAPQVDGVCCAVSPPEASTIAVVCTLPEHAGSDHVATTGKRILAAWTPDGTPVLDYDHAAGVTHRIT